jgi:hypothetical protein
MIAPSEYTILRAQRRRTDAIQPVLYWKASALQFTASIIGWTFCLREVIFEYSLKVRRGLFEKKAYIVVGARYRSWCGYRVWGEKIMRNATRAGEDWDRKRCSRLCIRMRRQAEQTTKFFM